jgi:hypothetical protein
MGDGMAADGSSNGSGRPAVPQRSRLSKSYIAIMLLAAASIALPYYFWRGTWFGSRLSDAQMRAYLTDATQPRHTQHALAQLTARLDAGDPRARELFPLVVDLAKHERSEIRGTAAWVMGWDNQHEPFRQALRGLVVDSAPFVQRNAALALSKFGDPAARPVLRSMLAPFTLKSPAAGKITKLIARGAPVHPNLSIGDLAGTNQAPRHVPAPVSGRVAQVLVADGATVAEGDALYELAPAEEDMWEALRALVLVGETDDIALIRTALNSSEATQRIGEQAQKTIASIESRRSSP